MGRGPQPTKATLAFRAHRTSEGEIEKNRRQPLFVSFRGEEWQGLVAGMLRFSTKALTTRFSGAAKQRPAELFVRQRKK